MEYVSLQFVPKKSHTHTHNPSTRVSVIVSLTKYSRVKVREAGYRCIAFGTPRDKMNTIVLPLTDFLAATPGSLRVFCSREGHTHTLLPACLPALPVCLPCLPFCVPAYLPPCSPSSFLSCLSLPSHCILLISIGSDDTSIFVF